MESAVCIRNGEIKTTPDVLTAISAIVPSDEDFNEALSIARVPRAALARYTLIALEQGRRGDKEPEFVPNSNEEQVNLEHVLPKRASHADWGAAFSADERKDYVNRLGNMALLQKGPNGRIGNKSFAAKKAILQKSKFGDQDDRLPAGLDESSNRQAASKAGWFRIEGVAAVAFGASATAEPDSHAHKAVMS